MHHHTDASMTASRRRACCETRHPGISRLSDLRATHLQLTIALRVSMICFSLILALLGGAANAAEPIVTSDLLRIRSVSSIDLAKDGSRCVLAVRSIGEKPRSSGSDNGSPYANQSHLFLVEFDDKQSAVRQLTFGFRNDHSPVLSPDGNLIAFVRSGAGRDSDNEEEAARSSQVWTMPVDGGEARQITTLKNGAGNPQWSPDGSRLLVQSSLPAEDIPGTPVWPIERPAREWGDIPPGTQADPSGTRDEIRAWLERNAAKHDPEVITRLDFQGEHRIKAGMRFTQLYLIDIAAEHPSVRALTNDFFDHQHPAFMPDGRSVLYSAKKSPEQHIDRQLESGIWQINIDGTNDRMVLAIDGWTLSNPRPNQEGSLIAFLGQQLDEPAFRSSQLGIMSLSDDAGEQFAWVTDQSNLDADIYSFRWRSTRTGLLFRTAVRGGFPLMEAAEGIVDPATIIATDDNMPVGVSAFDEAGGRIVYSTTTAANPCRLRVRDGFGERDVMDLNEWVAQKEIVLPEEAWISRPDGLRVQYWVMKPTNFDATQQYPTVLQIHGGPSVMWGPGEFSMWHEFQLLCSWGYVVVYANPRGSGGYGFNFTRGNFQNWGQGPAGDVLAALEDASIQPWIDDGNLVVTGGSYAGYLTAWIVGHDHRFKAAVAQRGVYELTTFFGEANAWRLVEWAFGGFPWDARIQPILSRESPFTYVNRIRTPLLIMHASQDLRTGVSQSELLYRALKQLGKPVEYVRYPDAGHDLSRTGDPTQRMDRLNRIIEFFERHVENPRPAPQIGAAAAVADSNETAASAQSTPSGH